jgi:hypothetical protein
MPSFQNSATAPISESVFLGSAKQFRHSNRPNRTENLIVLHLTGHLACVTPS